jgi:hypothetical protein
MKLTVESMATKARQLFDHMIKQGEERLSRREVNEFLGENYVDHYLLLVKALEATEKVIVKRGRGGIEYNPRRRAERQINPNNERVIRSYLNDNYDPDAVAIAVEALGSEKPLYLPLQEYFVDRDLYNFVQIYGDARGGGGVWKNPDLVCLRFTSELEFSLGIFPIVTGVEVKESLPTLKELQQARSYLSFCNSSYVCFYHGDYTGKDYDYLVESLREAEVWEKALDFNLGIIVAYRPTTRSSKFYFQIAREAPQFPLSPGITDDTIRAYFSEDAQKAIRGALKEQVVRLIGR